MELSLLCPALLPNALSCLDCLTTRQEQVESHTNASIMLLIAEAVLLWLSVLPLAFRYAEEYFLESF